MRGLARRGAARQGDAGRAWHGYAGSGAARLCASGHGKAGVAGLVPGMASAAFLSSEGR